MIVSIACVLAALLAPASQESVDPLVGERIGVLWGEVLSTGGDLPKGLMLEVRRLAGRGPTLEAPVMTDGHFTVRDFEAGEYEFTLRDGRGDSIQRDIIRIDSIDQPLTIWIRVPLKTIALPGAGTISAHQWLHAIPYKATKEFRSSRKAMKAGDLHVALAHLEKAIAIDPEFVEAYNNLGVCYWNLNENEKAAAAFQKAVTVDPGSAKSQLGLSAALNSLRRYPEAEGAARRAVQLDPNSGTARLELGRALAAQEQNTSEALNNLRKAVEQYPGARLIVAQVLVRQGAIAEAISELRQYLQSGHAEKKEMAEAWLAQLTQTSPP